VNARAVLDQVCGRTGQPPWRVHVLDETDSTNDRLREAMGGGGEWDRPWTVLAARFQGAGRGQGERGWWCPPDMGLLVSLRLDLDLERHALALLGHWAAAALAAVLQQALDERRLAARIWWKWPNDLWLEDAAGPGKLAGLLPQVAVQGRAARAVLGFGVNLAQRDFPPGLRQPARSLLQAGLALQAGDLLAGLLLELGRRGLPGPGRELLRELSSLDLLGSRPVILETGDGGEAVRLLPLADGGLRVEGRTLERTLHGGGLRVVRVAKEGLWCRLEE